MEKGVTWVIEKGRATCDCGFEFWVQCVGWPGEGKTDIDEFKYCPKCGKIIKKVMKKA